MINTPKEHIAVQGFEWLKSKIHGWVKTSSKLVAEEVEVMATTVLDQPLEFIESPTLKVVRLPLWPTRSHIDGLVQTGRLKDEDIFVGREACKNAKINEEVPQVFGYQIINDTELAKVITDKKALDVARKEVEVSGTFPTIYLLNHMARCAHAAYLGGRIPTYEEQKNFWDKLPGSGVLEKATSAGIPFLGNYSNNLSSHFDHHPGAGQYVSLISSTDNFSERGLELNRDFHLAKEVHFESRGSGSSSLIVFR